jgi:hypothetical protein
MPRQGTRSGLREDHDGTSAPVTPDMPLDAPVPENEAGAAAGPDAPETAEFPTLRTSQKRQGGVLQLMILAMLGIAIGFAVVMLI